jgi:rhamnosyltransferase
MKKVSVVIPTKNAGDIFENTLKGLKEQIYEIEPEIVVIDSGSTDMTLNLSRQYGAKIISIPPQEFNHGLTRNCAIKETSGEIIILLSQDAVPGDPYLIRNFVHAFNDELVAGAYARQVPRKNADSITKRNLNNWLTGRTEVEVRWIEDWEIYNEQSPMERYFFCNFDNVCSAIRRCVWEEIPFRFNYFGEDIEWAQQVLEAGWKITYCPDSFVIHSHNRSLKYEFTRNQLCHQKLYHQFGIAAIPSWKHLIISIWASSKSDWRYLLKNERRMFPLIKEILATPFMNFASLYGQYMGLRLALGQKNLTERL